MKNKKSFPIIFLIAIIIIAIISTLWTKINISKNPSNSNDYTPEEEISSNDLSKTKVTLYYLDSTNNNLKSEGKIINSNELLENPYKKIVQLLIEGPSSDSLKKVFPENTKILSATVDNNCVTLNFSEELLNFENEDKKYIIINSLLNSLAELNEVNSIKIQINGESCDSLNEEYSKIY